MVLTKSAEKYRQFSFTSKMAVPDTKLDNWKTADFTDYNILNVFVLCLMKKALFEQNQ